MLAVSGSVGDFEVLTDGGTYSEPSLHNDLVFMVLDGIDGSLLGEGVR